MTATTLTALMDANRGANGAITYLTGEHERRDVSFAELHERALGILHRLQRLGARPGDRLILLLSANEPFVDAFWAAILGGIVPVPVAVGISDEHRHKLLRIARQLGSPYIYTERRLLDRVGTFAATCDETPTFEALRPRAFLVDDLEDIGRAGKVHRAQPGDPAFIQFSSGSTSSPKGVVLTHANLIANIHSITAAAGIHERDVGLSWMPLTHDMGLIGFHLVMFANRAHSHLMPTDLFVRRPLLWLTLAARVHASLLCSPNFGYRHYLKALGERPVADMDLSAVRLLFNGAEPISVALCDEFMQRLAATGLARNSMFPVYGMAEASLAVSFPPPGRPWRTTQFDRHQLRIGAPVALTAQARDALALMSVGTPVPGCQVRIGDDADQALPGDHVGHIHIRGENVTAGYFDAPEANAAAFTADGWLRTGDLGVVHDGELYITGRFKEILFVNGQNYYPHDLERLLESVDGLELGKAVVAGLRAAEGQTDELVIFVLHRGEPADFVPLAQAAARCIGEQAGLEVAAVVPVHRIPKTTSGKVQRHLLEAQYLAGEYAAALAALPALQPVQAAASGAAAGTVGHIAGQLQTLCETVLDGRALDVDQNLFDIGASSLKLLAIHEQIERHWPGLVDVTDIFDHPTVGALAQLIQARLASGVQPGRVPDPA